MLHFLFSSYLLHNFSVVFVSLMLFCCVYDSVHIYSNDCVPCIIMMVISIFKGKNVIYVYIFLVQVAWNVIIISLKYTVISFKTGTTMPSCNTVNFG